MSATQDLDKLLDELRRTSLDYSSGRPPANGYGGTRTYNNSSRTEGSSFGKSSAIPTRYNTRYALSSGPSYNRDGNFGLSGGNQYANSSASYQRQTSYSTERQQYGGGGKPLLQRNNSYGYSTASYGGSGKDNVIFNTNSTHDTALRAPSPVPIFQTTYRTTLNHRPPTSPKRFNQINITVDPESGSNHSSIIGETRYQPTTLQTTRYQVSSGESHDVTDREKQLLEELSSAREELALLRRTSSAMDAPLRTPSTLPVQRRSLFNQQQQDNVHQQSLFSNRQQTYYQSHHDIQQESGLYRPTSRIELQNSGFHTSSSLPKRAMSSANVMNTQTWNHHNGVHSAAQSPTGFQTMRSTFGSSRMGSKLNIGEGYSARRERLRNEAEQGERLRQLQYARKGNMKMGNQVAASSNDLRMHQQRRQHYSSMSAIQTETGTSGFEEVETITLQPIGKGVQDLSSNMGSMNNLHRSRRAGASSMLEGLNSIDKYNNRNPNPLRNNTTTYGRQNSALDISSQVAPAQRGSTSFLSQRRTSGSMMSENIGTTTVDNRSQLKSTTPFLSSTTPRAKPSNFEIRPQQMQPQPQVLQMQQLQQEQQHQEMHFKQQQMQQRQQVVQSHKTWSKQAVNMEPPQPISLEDVQNTASSWYQLKISRQKSISLLKDKPAGSFVVRESTTFKHAYVLAVKSGKPPPNAAPKSGFAKFMKNILNDLDSDLVRHYLIEVVTTPKRGVRIKDFSVEPVFPTLVALIHHHTQQPLALPCTLLLPQVPPNQQLHRPSDPNLSAAGDSDSNTIVQMDVTANRVTPPITSGQLLNKPTPTHSTITSPLSPTAGLYNSDLTSPSPSFSCRCLYMGATEIDANSEVMGLIQAVDKMIPADVTTMQAMTCDELGSESPLQYTECQLQVATNEGILLTDLSRKIFFQRHFSSSSFVYAGIDPRDKMFVHPNHSALGLERPRIFGFIIKKLNGEFMCHVFSEFDANHSANEIIIQINAILAGK